GIGDKRPDGVDGGRDLLLAGVLEIHDSACSVRRSSFDVGRRSERRCEAGYYFFFASASRIARHTLLRLIGMSICRMPSGDSASTTALTNAAGLPTLGLSPTPLAPIG